MTKTGANRLINSTSPYLLQHAFNPVDWYPWNKEAHDQAVKKDIPILLSIGYSSCHWCHVMERESFENKEIAQVMNDNFINIKVDREERPDIDQIYMDAVQALGSQGGWPLTVFLTPALKPIYGGTYFPPDSFKNLLEQISSVFKTRREELETSADQVTLAISGSEIEKFGLKYNDQIDFSRLHVTYENLKRKFDEENGGMQRTPKFPMPGTWDFLMHYGFLFKKSNALEHTLFTLDKISDGGIYDQIGGGFARYSTDKKWLVPHFEKMLYDNGQLMSLFAKAYAISKKARYLEVMDETLDWLEREMLHTEGGFYSALDADSEGIEGKHYVWSWKEFTELAGTDAELLANFFGVTREGNWEGNNILVRNSSIEIDDNILSKLKSILLTARNNRVKPGLDDKIVCSWNALMSSGLIDAFNATGDEKFIRKAIDNADFIKHGLFKKEKLYRSWKDGKLGAHGFLEDYTFTSHMFSKLYQATFNEDYLAFSEKLLSLAMNYFHNPKDKFFFFAEPSQDLITRKVEVLDNVIPGSNSMMARCLYEIGTLSGNQEFITYAKELTLSVLDLISAEPEYASNWALLYSFFTYPTSEVAIIGSDYKEVSAKIRANYLPNKVVAAAASQSSLPLLSGKSANGKTLIYVCRNHTCGLPVDSPEDAINQLLSLLDTE